MSFFSFQGIWCKPCARPDATSDTITVTIDFASRMSSAAGDGVDKENAIPRVPINNKVDHVDMRRVRSNQEAKKSQEPSVVHAATDHLRYEREQVDSTLNKNASREPPAIRTLECDTFDASVAVHLLRWQFRDEEQRQGGGRHGGLYKKGHNYASGAVTNGPFSGNWRVNVGSRVLAVWKGNGHFYHAIVRCVKEREGIVIVDWLRPAPLSNEVLRCVCDAGGDDTLHRHVAIRNVKLSPLCMTDEEAARTVRSVSVGFNIFV
eukprot:TRINITY_DN50058_c0_g1_i1.p1 TRINITY_DN50058_c0_g1~~TRINITY_DN50058_c0_g1_i1.p1  ORF type:complete len:263 (-),score=25.81 TRINITY_DN50058_c0_g1_i1:48-836(-)